MNTLASLTNLLIEYGVDISKYGQGTSKTLEQLLKEIREEESHLVISDGILVRNVSVLLISIKRDDDRVLTEVNQMFHRTETRAEYSRQRNCVLAEKMLPEEDVLVGVRRALEEELGMHVQDISIHSLTRTVEKKTSQSYPDLTCSYNTVRVTILENTLPCRIEDNYVFTEYFDNGEPRVTATWKWL